VSGNREARQLFAQQHLLCCNGHKVGYTLVCARVEVCTL
jgi:hypothetical protein